MSIKVELHEYECPRCHYRSNLVGGKRAPFCGRGHKLTDMTLTHPQAEGTVSTSEEATNGKSRRKQ